VPVPSSPRERAARLIAALEEMEAADRVVSEAPAAQIRVARAPGRVNLIGEHTDYNEGLALPVAIDLELWLAYRPWPASRVELASIEVGETAAIDLTGLDPASGGGRWIDYVAGVAWAARRAGLRIQGFRGVLDSTLPIGTGLSSSAALEMVALEALLVSPRSVDPVGRARLGRTSENDYVHVPTGLMDQLASAAGEAGMALLLDCRSLEIQPVPLPAGVAVVALDTGVARGLHASEYGARRGDCEAGVQILAEHEPGISALRDVSPELLEQSRDMLPERVYRRCRHVVEENARVLATATALRHGDLDEVGRQFAASHSSLRDLFEVVSAEQDAMVEIARAVPGVVAARMTGGGFGGCTVNLVREDAIEALREAVQRRYPESTGRQAKMHVTRAVAGAGPVSFR
jgi:galactokinase